MQVGPGNAARAPAADGPIDDYQFAGAISNNGQFNHQSTAGAAESVSSYQTIKEGWGSKSTFMYSYGLKFEPDDIEEGKRILDAYMNQDQMQAAASQRNHPEDETHLVEEQFGFERYSDQEFQHTTLDADDSCGEEHMNESVASKSSGEYEHEYERDASEEFLGQSCNEQGFVNADEECCVVEGSAGELYTSEGDSTGDEDQIEEEDYVGDEDYAEDFEEGDYGEEDDYDAGEYSDEIDY